MQIISCAACGIEFGIPDDLYDRRRKDGEAFACPNGHHNVFRETEIDKLKKQIKQLQENLAWYRTRLVEAERERDYWKRAANGYKGQWRKAVKRSEYKPPIEPPPADLAHGE